MIRTPQALIPYALALACLSGGALWHLSNEMPLPGQVVTRGTAQVGGPFSLMDQNGQMRSDADFRGRWMLVYFGYTNCPDVCPTTLALISSALKDVGPSASQLVPIFVTVDPAHDTPPVLRQYLSAFDLQFVGLTGTESQIERIARAYKVWRVRRPLKGGGYAIDHSNVICLMGPNGKFVTVYDNSQTPEEIAKDLRKRLST